MPAAQIRTSRLGLVGCVKTKRDRPAPARELYGSPLFQGRRRYIESSCERWWILSARHGLLEPDAVIERYDEELKTATAAERRGWSQHVLAALDRLAIEYSTATFEIHAGAEYRNFGLVAGLDRRGAAVEVPAEHLSRGQQLSFYAGRLPPRPAAMGHPPAGRSPSRGSYAGLSEYLQALDALSVTLSFVELERILGRPLPPSARLHRAWWSVDRSETHTHARSWTEPGWAVDHVELNPGMVRFVHMRL